MLFCLVSILWVFEHLTDTNLGEWMKGCFLMIKDFKEMPCRTSFSTDIPNCVSSNHGSLLRNYDSLYN